LLTCASIRCTSGSRPRIVCALTCAIDSSIHFSRRTYSPQIKYRQHRTRDSILWSTPVDLLSNEPWRRCAATRRYFLSGCPEILLALKFSFFCHALLLQLILFKARVGAHVASISAELILELYQLALREMKRGPVISNLVLCAALTANSSCMAVSSLLVVWHLHAMHH
jgi:hypothetical protein